MCHADLARWLHVAELFFVGSEFAGVDFAGSSEFVFRHRRPYTLQECNVLFRVVVQVGRSRNFTGDSCKFCLTVC
nr:hypothetical protein Iba_chr06aCG5600 [Ipomoea batatas]GMD06754.1 hypothetical protein Iba_chr06cCG0640 [Ipomoea batatas]GMD77667.1 hypothetical protein Iba_chr13cCG5590 [Ipomoea batatas]GMD94817.1 hypothetical protein Iba_chr15aCG6230 [Ipomoea batatas]